MGAQEVVERDQAGDSRPVRASWDMSLKELEATPWAREFKADSPVSYPEAVQYAHQKNLRVYIYKTDETGEVQWAIAVLDESRSGNFWMDAKPTKKDAIALCRLMGWKVSS